ncbi:MAG: hypothetical protein R6X06_11040 [Gammaproteobacteria bacterium]
MNRIGLKLLTSVLLLMHLTAPAQAAVMGMGQATSGQAVSPCAQHQSTPPTASAVDPHAAHLTGQLAEQHEPPHHSGVDCCQQHQACEGHQCSQCQPCAALAMLVNLHRQAVMPALSALLLAPTAAAPQGIAAQNLYRPPIDLL